MKSAMFMIEGGRALEMVKEHIAERKRVRDFNRSIMAELGAENMSVSRLDGTLFGLVFESSPPAEFCKPDREGVSRPRKGSEWAKRFKAQKGYRQVEGWIADEFGIPMAISYKGKNCHGSRCIGAMFNACGFLFLGEAGPYAMWAPDVQAEVAKTEADGYEVEEPAKSFVFSLDGCRRIEKEEWEILALQNKLAQKQAA